MQLLKKASNREVDASAQALLDTVPLVMRVIRENMRRHRSGLTVPQFRTLCFVSSATGNSLSAVADFIGLSLPAMSRLVDGLVEQGLMIRRPCDDDRRHVRLSVTPDGEEALGGARLLAQTKLADVLSRLAPEQRTTVASAMHILRDAFTPEVAPNGVDTAVAASQ